MLHNQFDIQCLLLIVASGIFEVSHERLAINAKLSYREKSVLSHLSRGKTAKEIGMLLDISARTVEHHIANIKYKTNCHSRSELINLYWSGR